MPLPQCSLRLLLACFIASAVGKRARKGRYNGGTLPVIRLRQRDGGERVFVDETGREVLLHGVNAVVKGPPWHPDTSGFSLDVSMVERDFQIMHSLGLNLIRLGVMWPGVEPEEGEYNSTYIKTIKHIADTASRYGIYTLLDMHQDVLSEYFCGEGIPRWAVETDKAWLFSKFPAPVDEPYTCVDDQGFPCRQDCAKHDWPSYYGPEVVGAAYDALYQNENGLTDKWALFWEYVTTQFRNVSHILGVELINEPFAGDFYRNPDIMVPIGSQAADHSHLQPAYDILAKAIRQADPDRLIFFAGVTWGDLGSQFTRAPNGASEVSVLAFHYYVPPQLPTEYKILTNVQFDEQIKVAQKLGTGFMLTETAGLDGNFEQVADAADRHLTSFATWEWKSFCRETPETINSTSQNAAFGACKTGYGQNWNSTTNLPVKASRYARTYARAVAGNVVSMKFDRLSTKAEFSLKYILSENMALSTEIFFSPEYYYPRGIEIDVKPPSIVSAEVNSTARIITLRALPKATGGEEISIVVRNKG